MKTNILSVLALGAVALSASAQYRVVITDKEGTKTSYETSNVNNIRFESEPNFIKVHTLVGAEYGSDDNGNGQYYICFGTGEPTSSGEPAGIGDIQIALELTAAKAEDSANAVLPNGYYTRGTGATPNTFNVQKSGIWIRLAEGSDGVTVAPLIDGSVTVEREGDEYVLKCDFILLTGETIAVEYDGDINFIPAMSENDSFTSDFNVNFEGGQGRYWANWFQPFAVDAALELYTGEFNENGSQTKGYWFYAPIYMPLDFDANIENPSTYIADGVYTIDPREKVDFSSYLPFTMSVGSTIDYWGTIYPSGTYITYVENGHTTRGLIKSGTMTVSNKGTKFELDLVDENGIHVTGSYNGKPNIRNLVDNSEKPDLSGTLTGNHTLDFLPGTIAMSYPMGDYIKSGLYQFTLMVSEPNMEHGDFLMFELSADQQVLPDGTYTIDNGLKPFSGYRGYCDYGGNLIFSWYGDLDSTDPVTGAQSVVAPINGGTITISTTAQDTRKIVFNLKDEKGNDITGTYEGVLYDLPQEQAAPAKAKAQKLGVKKTNASLKRVEKKSVSKLMK